MVRTMMISILLAGASIVGVGCGGDSDPDPGMVDAEVNTTPDALQSAGITVLIRPDVATAGQFVSIDVTSTILTFVEPDGPLVEGEGHYHLYFNGDAENYFEGTVNSYDFNTTGAPVGTLTATAYLVDNQHTPLSPRVEGSDSSTLQ